MDFENYEAYRKVSTLKTLIGILTNILDFSANMEDFVNFMDVDDWKNTLHLIYDLATEVASYIEAFFQIINDNQEESEEDEE